MRKPDAAAIRSYLDEVKNRFEIKSDKRDWLSYAYHFAPIESIASILNDGFLRSRNNCLSEGIGFQNIADPEILRHTPPDVADYVRLYYRNPNSCVYGDRACLSLRIANVFRASVLHDGVTAFA
jgi:hypothetical protein